MSQKVTINPGWEYIKRMTYAAAVRKGNMLFISGVDASEPDPASGRVVAKGDIVAQTKVIYERLKSILEAAGASFEDIVWTTDYITTTRNYRGTAEIRRQYFGENFPASTGIIVKGLVREGALIEIDAVAVLD